MAYRTVDAPGETQVVVKGSTFRGLAERVATPDAAETRLAELRARYADATHVCHAYRVGRTVRFADDGEPAGTAGRPIFEVVSMRELDRVLVAVVRWYGGTKLGAGGLVRAYSRAAAQALDAAGVREVVDTVALVVEAPFRHADAVLRLVAADRGARAGEPAFTAAGLRLELVVAADRAAALRAALADATRGQANVRDAG